MHVDILVAEIGSTTTVVNAFTLDGPALLAQGYAPTSVEQGDVRIGLRQAMDECAALLGAASPLEYDHFLATSSAAGGLKMTVHGLVYDMTVKAAREAALGAGANLLQITAGKMRPADLEEMAAIRPNIILIAGGVDYGERDTALSNAEHIAAILIEHNLKPPVLYAGNIENQKEISALFHKAGIPITCVENVYPVIDELNVGPCRKEIQRLFEEHITEAPGMQYVRELVDGSITPTPGAVMKAAELISRDLQDLLVFDVGGATTDVHSVTRGSPEISVMLTAPEPESKRSVEGDLGLFLNRKNLVKVLSSSKGLFGAGTGVVVGDRAGAGTRVGDRAGAIIAGTRKSNTGVNNPFVDPTLGLEKNLEKDFGKDLEKTLKNDFGKDFLAGLEVLSLTLGYTIKQTLELVEKTGPIPARGEEAEIWLMEELTYGALQKALERHAGRVRNLYGPAGRIKVAEGKDLTAVRTVIGTGGALTRLPGGKKLLKRVLESMAPKQDRWLVPSPQGQVLVDSHYIMASAGALAHSFPEAAQDLLLDSLGLGTVNRNKA